MFQTDDTFLLVLCVCVWGGGGGGIGMAYHVSVISLIIQLVCLMFIFM